MVCVSKKIKDKYKRQIQSLINGLSRKVSVYLFSKKSECPNCSFDKFSGCSTGKCDWTVAEAIQKQEDWIAAGNTTLRYKYFLRGRCPICVGKGYLETQRKRYVPCLVTWNPQNRYGNEMSYSPAGSEGSILVRLKTDPKYFDTFKNCSRLVIDGIGCKLSRPPLLRGLGNQSILVITAFTTEKPKVDTNEIIKDYT